jgi:transposase
MDMAMTASESPATVSEVVLGVDTHLEMHVAVALDGLGRRLGELAVSTTTKGYEKLICWAQSFGTVGCAGVEGTGSYGAGLTRYLRAAGISVVEVERPKRRHLRRNGKSDPIDAEAAARAVLADDIVGEPKSGDGQVEMIRSLRSARQSALLTKDLVDTCARFRPRSDLDEVHTATKFALRSVARRYQQLSKEIAELDEQLDRLVAKAAPELTALRGVGTDHAATLLTVAGDNPQRLKSEASFASLCGVSPIEASSGKVVRHRLNRGGDRDANRALHLICVVRMRHDQRTKEYVARRTAEGKSKREIMRCLKRYIAREIYRLLAPIAAASPPTAPGSQAA